MRRKAAAAFLLKPEVIRVDEHILPHLLLVFRNASSCWLLLLDIWFIWTQSYKVTSAQMNEVADVLNLSAAGQVLA